MAKNKGNDKKVEQITDMEVDFAQWFTDVCKKAELIDYSSTKGMVIYRPYGYAIWENIQKELEKLFCYTLDKDCITTEAIIMVLSFIMLALLVISKNFLHEVLVDTILLLVFWHTAVLVSLFLL